jgi:hypothetical protein
MVLACDPHPCAILAAGSGCTNEREMKEIVLSSVMLAFATVVSAQNTVVVVQPDEWAFIRDAGKEDAERVGQGIGNMLNAALHKSAVWRRNERSGAAVNLKSAERHCQRRHTETTDTTLYLLAGAYSCCRFQYSLSFISASNG